MRHLLLLAILTLSGCKPAAPPPPPCSPAVSNAAHVWGNSKGAYHLPHDALSPVVVNTSGYKPDLAAWNVLGTPVQLRKSGDGFKMHIIRGGDAHSGWLGLASVNLDSGNHITAALVTMNTTLLKDYHPTVAKHVLCQEIGHLFGLDHQRQANDSCMDDCQGRGAGGWLACLSTVAGMTPNAHDAEQLNAIYAHTGPDKPPHAPPGQCVGTVLVHEFGLEGHEHRDH